METGSQSPLTNIRSAFPFHLNSGSVVGPTYNLTAPQFTL